VKYVQRLAADCYVDGIGLTPLSGLHVYSWQLIAYVQLIQTVMVDVFDKEAELLQRTRTVVFRMARYQPTSGRCVQLASLNEQ